MQDVCVPKNQDISIGQRNSDFNFHFNSSVLVDFLRHINYILIELLFLMRAFLILNYLNATYFWFTNKFLWFFFPTFEFWGHKNISNLFISWAKWLISPTICTQNVAMNIKYSTDGRHNLKITKKENEIEIK